MACRILYLGDTALNQQACYLAGIMSHCGHNFDYLRSDQTFDSSLLDNDYGLVIISDYPAANFAAEQLETITQKVKAGTSILMIGGWESFVGLSGGYNETCLTEVLPVIMKDSDDRLNLFNPCLAVKEREHEVLGDLPFDSHTPAIGGLCDLEAKSGAEVILSALEHKVSRNGDSFRFNASTKHPLLVMGSYGKGWTAAFASDVAPHWVGPFVDWGDKRINAQAPNAEAVEVGSWYVQFFSNLIHWLCGN